MFKTYPFIKWHLIRFGLYESENDFLLSQIETKLQLRECKDGKEKRGDS